MASATHPSGGNFSRFPAELRNQLWSECSYEAKSSLMATCKLLRHEIKDFLYDDATLSFNLFPQVASEPSPSKVKVTDECERTLCHLSLGALQNEEDLRFWTFPFHKLDAFNFILWPPRTDQPGEMIRLWKMITNLLAALRGRVKRWPSVVVDFSKSRWETRGVFQQSGQECFLWAPSGPPYKDIDLAMMPFCTLRQLPSAPQLKYPEGTKIYTLRPFHHFIIELGPDPRPFGTKLDREKTKNDIDFEDLLRRWSLGLENQLDSGADASSASLRLERCANWSQTFEKQCVDWFAGRRRGWGWSYSRGFEECMKQALWDRYREMQVADPCSVTVNNPLILQDLHRSQRLQEVHGSKHRWWESYKDGLPILLHQWWPVYYYKSGAPIPVLPHETCWLRWYDRLKEINGKRCYENFWYVDEGGIRSRTVWFHWEGEPPVE